MSCSCRYHLTSGRTTGSLEASSWVLGGQTQEYGPPVGNYQDAHGTLELTWHL